MAARIPQEVREQQIAELCEGTIYSFVRWQGEFKGVRSKFTYMCEKHGEQTGKVEHFVNGTRCPMCGVSKRMFSQEERQNQFEKELQNTIYSFTRWSYYDGKNTSGVVFNCQRHGEWETSVRSFVGGSRCPKCSKETSSEKQRFDVEKRTEQVIKLCEDSGYTFEGWCDSYRNALSTFNCRCGKHGIWKVGFSAFKHGTRCPSCAKTGFNPDKPAWLYCLISEDNLLKVGITNNIKTRISQLRTYTPFSFEVLEKFKNVDGHLIRELERQMHLQFESANLKGFQGCTEWLKWNPKIPLWFRFLNG